MSYIEPVLLIDAQTADETTSVPVFVGASGAVTFFVRGAGTTSSGVVTLEEASSPSYVGTWSSLTTVNASDVSGGAEKGVHVAMGAGQWVRARISTAIGGGGTISVLVTGL